MKKLLNVLKWVGIVLGSAIVLFFIVRFAGQCINRRVPEGGINEAKYVEINGSRQWISIYGEDLDNPVLLYLHGGPGSSTSSVDYAALRKLGDIYTVVTWDQRDCGKSWTKEQDDTVLTREMLMQDGKELTEYLLDYLGKEKLTLFGHSWGTLYGANLALESPEYYDAFIGSGQVVDMTANEEAFIEAAKGWAADDPETLEFLAGASRETMTMDYFMKKDGIMEKYGYNSSEDELDYSIAATVIFNPWYSLGDWVDYFRWGSSMMDEDAVYSVFDLGGGLDAFSLDGRYEYEIPFYNINGDHDYQANFELAQEYFDLVQAPDKAMLYFEDAGHMSPLYRSEELSEKIREIAARQ